jgi:hypothetical protein
VSFQSGHAATFSQPQISLNSNASIVFLTSIASAGMITIGIVILIDFFLDSIDKKGKINDGNEILSWSIVPSIFVWLVGVGSYEIPPFAFVIIQVLQLCGLSFALLKLLNRVYRMIFTSSRTHVLCTLSSLTLSFSMVGFGESFLYWPNLLAFSLNCIFTGLFTVWLRAVIIEHRYMTKKFSEYRTDEVYAVSYVIFYLLLLQIHGNVRREYFEFSRIYM